MWRPCVWTHEQNYLTLLPSEQMGSAATLRMNEGLQAVSACRW